MKEPSTTVFAEILSSPRVGHSIIAFHIWIDDGLWAKNYIAWSIVYLVFRKRLTLPAIECLLQNRSMFFTLSTRPSDFYNGLDPANQWTNPCFRLPVVGSAIDILCSKLDNSLHHGESESFVLVELRKINTPNELPRL